MSQLISAVNNLQSGQTISLAAGTYNLSGVTDALYIPQGINNWTIRGATGDRDDVVIRGAGMSGSVRFGIWIGTSPGGTIADLTIDGVRDHGIIVNYGAHDLLVHNLRIVDSGDQFVKSNPNGANNDGNDRGIVEYSVFEYRTTDNNNYTNGVDVHAGDGWIVRYNLFRNFLSPTGQATAGPAVLAWNGSSNTTVEGNTFINVARGVSLGLIDKAGGFDHQGGLIANNIFYRDPILAAGGGRADLCGGFTQHQDLPQHGAQSGELSQRHRVPLCLQQRLADSQQPDRCRLPGPRRRYGHGQRQQHQCQLNLVCECSRPAICTCSPPHR